jgi:hypothetical protein
MAENIQSCGTLLQKMLLTLTGGVMLILFHPLGSQQQV